MKRIAFLCFILTIGLTLGVPMVFAQDTIEVEAEVLGVVNKRTDEGIEYFVIEAADQDGRLFEVDTSEGYVDSAKFEVEEGDRVLLQVIENLDGSETVFLVDVVRSGSLLWIALIFAAIAIAVGRWRGALAIVGLAVTLAILFWFVFPQILAGRDPVLMTVIGSAVILAVNMHLAHGLSRGTFAAFLGTIGGLILTLIFANLFVGLTGLSGLGSEESTLLFYKAGDVIIPKGILLAGIILGAVGALDDVAVTQGEAVSEIKQANLSLSRRELFTRAMRIGRHHIASTVNTLVLAYAGVAMPLLLLFMVTSDIGTLRFINEEVVAEEIVRTIAGTAALVLTVPLATWFATFVHKK
ncbi:MAG: YibE/F family protein [bacterium]